MKSSTPFFAALLISAGPNLAMAGTDVQLRPVEAERGEAGLQEQAQRVAEEIQMNVRALAEARDRAKACLDQAAGAVDKTESGIRTVACRVTLMEAAADTYNKSAGQLSDLSNAAMAKARAIQRYASETSQAIAALEAEKTQLLAKKKAIAEQATALGAKVGKDAQLSLEQRKAVADLRREDTLADMKLASIENRRHKANQGLGDITKASAYYGEASVRLYANASKMRSNGDRFMLAIDDAKFGAVTDSNLGTPFIKFEPLLQDLRTFDPSRFDDVLGREQGGDGSEVHVPNLPADGADDDLKWLRSFGPAVGPSASGGR